MPHVHAWSKLVLVFPAVSRIHFACPPGLNLCGAKFAFRENLHMADMKIPGPAFLPQSADFNGQAFAPDQVTRTRTLVQ
jgi:hypothetical protein